MELEKWALVCSSDFPMGGKKVTFWAPEIAVTAVRLHQAISIILAPLGTRIWRIANRRHELSAIKRWKMTLFQCTRKIAGARDPGTGVEILLFQASYQWYRSAVIKEFPSWLAYNMCYRHGMVYGNDPYMGKSSISSVILIWVVFWAIQESYLYMGTEIEQELHG